MDHGHAYGDIGHGQGFANCIAAQDRNRNRALGRSEVNSHYLNPEFLLDFVQQVAMAATDVQHLSHRKRVEVYSIDDRIYIAEPAVHACQIAVT